MAHPRANGQVERANGMILDALRKKVFDKSEKLAGKWIRELPYVVWKHPILHGVWVGGSATCEFDIWGAQADL
jgi:hypothetical protein